jgi:tripartite-type tricarboxylate transporter receptor subunit TctC
MSRAWCTAVSIAAMAALSQTARAQDLPAPSAQGYPARPVRVTIGFAPGGGVDILARVVAQRLTEQLGRPFVMENRAGAGGTTAYAMVAKSPPDGYTLLAVSGSYAISSALYSNLPYDPVKDFAPITLMGAAPFLVVVHPSLPVKTIGDLIALAKAKPGMLDFASGGYGSSGHLTGEMFKAMAGVKMTYIPYKGGDLALIDLVGGQVHVVFSNILSSLPHVKTGRARAIAVTSTTRSSILPQVPTIAESGVAGYEAVNWYGWLAPAGTPAAIVNRLNAAIGEIVKTADMRERLPRDGAEPAWSTPAQLSRHLVTDIARWRKVIRDAKVRVE